MKRIALPIAIVFLTASACFGIMVTLFSDTPRHAKIMSDIILARCDRTDSAKDYGDGLYPVDVTVTDTLKGNLPAGPMKIVTIYPMAAGKSYLLSTLGGSSVDGITFFAVPELSVVELPERFDIASLKGKPLVEQLNAVFAARQDAIERQQAALKEEADLLAKALTKKPGP